ncbi:transposase [Wolbachia endosymbiont (group A) of Colletes cunicularius]
MSFSSRGNLTSVGYRTIINAIRYMMRTGCQWRQLPKDFPPWKTVYSCN